MNDLNLKRLRAAKFFLIAAIAGFAQIAVGPSLSLAQSQSLESEPLTIVTSRGNFPFMVEIADEPREREIGLMNREKLEAREGMLFVFRPKRIVSMWMKNTLFPLDMVFVADDGTVAAIVERTVPHSLEIISSPGPMSYVLELNAGMAAFIGLRPGDMLKHRFFQKT